MNPDIVNIIYILLNTAIRFSLLFTDNFLGATNTMPFRSFRRPSYARPHARKLAERLSFPLGTFFFTSVDFSKELREKKEQLFHR